ncbi:MAG: pantetheine-phosphate adenylyltransferase [Puniceicoccaceae bacterium]
MRLAIYPGTFDPVTLGHLDVLRRATRIFDELIVAVAANETKGPIFSVEKRKLLIEENIQDLSCVRVLTFDGLLVDFARKVGAIALIRGLRAVSDFEYEFQMAQMNRNLDGGIETIYLMPNEKFFYTSSNLVKQVYRFTNRQTGLVPQNVHHCLNRHFRPEARETPQS